MSDFSRLLKRAFENKGNKNLYKSGAYEIAFEERAWKTLFWVSYNRVPVMQGNTFDKEVALCTNESVHPYKKLLNAVWEVLPDYKIVGENYEKYMESEGQVKLLEAVEVAIHEALRDEHGQFILVDKNGNYNNCRAGTDVNAVFEDEKLVGKVEWFCVGGVAKAGFVEFEEALFLSEYMEQIGVCVDVGELIENVSARCEKTSGPQKENLEIDR